MSRATLASAGRPTGEGVETFERVPWFPPKDEDDLARDIAVARAALAGHRAEYANRTTVWCSCASWSWG